MDYDILCLFFLSQNDRFFVVDDGGMSMDFDLECPGDQQDPPQAASVPSSSRPLRQRRMPRRFLDAAPDVSSDEDEVDLGAEVSQPVENGSIRVFETRPNKFGLRKVFRRIEMSEGNCLENSEGRAPYQDEAEASTKERLGPFPNESTYRLFQWFYSGSHTLSLDQFVKLQEVLSSDSFVSKDLRGVDIKRLAKRLGTARIDKNFDSRDGWVERSLKIDVPLGHLDKDAPLKAEFAVEQFFHRPLLGVIRSVFESKVKSAGFVYEPYEVRFKSPYGGQEMNVYGELYWSKKFRDAHEEVQLLPRGDGDNLPQAIVALQIWSDGMCAAKFGNAKLWPAYLQFGNQSKYERAKPGMCHHIAHIPSVRIFPV